MAVKSGAGASVSSGASYQARVGAYVIASSFCDMDSDISHAGMIDRISFETAEAVDDINIVHLDGSRTFLQAKAIISYSVAVGSELRSAMEQFAKQDISDKDRLILVTSGRSTKKVVNDLRVALDAFRLSPEMEFYRDQPKAACSIIDEVRGLVAICRQTDAAIRHSMSADDLVRRISLVVLDVEAGETLEQAMVILLRAREYSAAQAVWSKLISDCLGFSKSRRTIQLSELSFAYEKFKMRTEEQQSVTPHDWINIEFRGDIGSVGKELTLCIVPAGSEPFPEGYIIVETYRFDENCNERLRFQGETVSFGNGKLTVKLLRRTSTYEGMTRCIKADPHLIGQNNVTIMPMNSEEDCDHTPCAEIHRNRLKSAAAANSNPLNCVHCGKAVFSVSAPLVELTPFENPIVGLSHSECLQPIDRVIGITQSDLFEAHAELVNFDANAWYRSAHCGQIGLAGVYHFSAVKQASFLWAGRKRKGPNGDFVVEMELDDGTTEIVTRRNEVQRFPKTQADQMATKFQGDVVNASAEGNPLCLTDQTKSFALKSELLKQIGVNEKIREIVAVRVKPFNVQRAALYSRPGHWYAPIMYLKERDTGEPISYDGAVMMLTNPFKLSAYLENWTAVGIEIPNYETALLLDDEAFDHFMAWNEDRGCTAIIDPVVDPSDLSLVSGHFIVSPELQFGS